MADFEYLDWELEFILSGRALRWEGVGSQSVDIANWREHIAIEIDGNHTSRECLVRSDQIKNERLARAGWRLVRLKNKDILRWYSAGELRDRVTAALADIGFALVNPEQLNT